MSVPYAPARWPSAAATTAVWALAAASIVFWGLRLAAPADAPAPPAVAGTPQAALDPAAVAQVLGAVPAQAAVAATPEAASRFVLLGVVADAEQRGVALIAVDGKPPRPFRVGATVADGFVLQSLGPRSAALGARADSASAFALQLPARPLATMTPPAPLPPQN
jgi:general secretion pathway protein C